MTEEGVTAITVLKGGSVERFSVSVLGSSVHGGLAVYFWDHGGQSLWRKRWFTSQREEAESEEGSRTRYNLQRHAPNDTMSLARSHLLVSSSTFLKSSPSWGPSIQQTNLYRARFLSRLQQDGRDGERRDVE